MRLIREEKTFIREAVLLMLPMILQNFVTFSMSMADTFMVGVLGETALARLGADLHDLALLDDEHALPVGDGDARAGGDDVLVAVCVARAAGGFFLSFHGQHIGWQGLTGEEFFPLVGQNAAGSARGSFDQSHIQTPFW